MLEPGRNCWRREAFEKAAFLIDGEAYFHAFRAVALQAKQSIFIIGWDVDTQIELVKGEDQSSGFPRRLGEFLVALLRRKRKLRVYVLNWDFAMIYAWERQWMPTAEPGWSRHRRFSYEVDGQHPLGASHHQKVVVIDDTIAFVGGLDLSKSRWDTSAHVSQDPRRINPDGTPYAPFHDVQMMVSGEAAAALGDLARGRWLNATGRRLGRSERRAVKELWPPALQSDIADWEVGILRTQPAYEAQPEAREIQHAYLDAIKSARQSIYIESQYFTAHVIGRALAARLSEQNGPEVVLVLRHDCDGWLERQTMDALRARVLNEMEMADHYHRLRVYAPMVPVTEGRDYVVVHSKLLIVDEEFLCLGSANVSNRSMGFDTECNLAIASDGRPEVRTAIAGLRNRLLSEHLGVAESLVKEHIASCGSLIGTIEALRNGRRSLEDECFGTSREGAALIPEHLLIDPERPIAADQFLDSVMHRREQGRMGRRSLAVASVLAATLVLAAAWRWTPLGDLVTVEGILESVQSLGRGPLGWLTLLSSYILGGLLVFPLTLLIVVTLVAFGPLVGPPTALVGSLLSAMAIFGLGRLLGRYRVQRLAGRRMSHLAQRIAERGMWAVLLVRLLPIAPFSTVNLVAGATPITLRDYVLGTALGMAPGIVVMAMFIDRLEAVVRRPTPLAFVVLGFLIAGAWACAWYLSRRLQQGRHDALPADAPSSTVTACP